MRVSIKNVLTKNGYEVAGEAANGIQGFEMYQELKPDLVTMDFTMPEMDGLTILKKILEFDASAKVVMVSAMGQESIVREAITSGAKGFIVKPFEEGKILSTLNGIG